VPPILRKSFRVILVAPGVSSIPNLTILAVTDPPLSFHSASREAALCRLVYGLLIAPTNAQRSPEETRF
jgi:hypothetical protein